jgi:hypothetical protein
MPMSTLGVLVGVQGAVLGTLAARLVGGRTRRPAERPRPE